MIDSTIDFVTTVLVDDPKDDTVHQPYSAFNQGFNAFELGLIRSCNPYESRTERIWWFYGYDEAKEQSMQATWKVIILYAGGYLIEDEDGNVVSDGLNSHWVMQAAIEKAKVIGKEVTFAYFEEEHGGLEPCKPWGPLTNFARIAPATADSPSATEGE
jgi:ribosome modulation factor